MKKELYKDGHYHLGILDRMNYYLYDERRDKVDKNGKITHKYKYYQYLHFGIQEMARLIANENSEELESWIVAYRKEVDKMTSIFESAMSVDKVNNEPINQE